MSARWRVELFGGLRVLQGDRVVTRFRTQKAASLLAYLAYHRERSHPREMLVEMLWPDCDEDVGRRRLSVALSLLRQPLEAAGGLGEGLFLTDHFAIGVNPACFTTDVADFAAALQSGAEAVSAADRIRHLAEAAELYRGELLTGYYEEWIFPEQQRREEQAFQATSRLIALLEDGAEYDRALAYALRAVSVHRLREEAHRELMRVYAAGGQHSNALRQYRELERILKEELDETPSEATRALADEIGRSATEGEKRRRGEGESRQGPDGLLLGSPSPLLPFSSSSPERLNARTPERLSLEPVGGAVPLNSPFYVVRPIDEQLRAVIARGDSIVLLKGASQVGKTSLLARGLQQARQAGARIVLTDLQKLNAAQLASAEMFCRTLAEWIADQLDLDVLPDEVWNARRGPSANLERYLRREVLSRTEAPIVWGLDEVDRLFEHDFGSEVFRLFRAWYNERALDPTGPWARLTLVIAYATEAHLFITNLNQSPFNVGTQLELEDFTLDQVGELNLRHGSPLQNPAEIARLYRLVGGHPLLVRLGLREMTARGIPISALEARSDQDDGVFGGYLKRIWDLLDRDPTLCDAFRSVLQGRPCPTAASFYRLRSAGIVAGDSPEDTRPRCQLYATYLGRHLV